MWLKKKDKQGGEMILGQLIFILMISVGAIFSVLSQSVHAETETNLAKIQTIELFVKSGTAIVRLDEQDYPNIKAIVHVVDEADLILAQLNKILKITTVEAEARKLAAPYIQDPEFIAQLKRAHLAQLQAQRYQLREYPSAVINRGEGLVLGDVDMNSIVDLVSRKGFKE
jgi:Ribonuclease G/E